MSCESNRRYSIGILVSWCHLIHISFYVILLIDQFSCISDKISYDENFVVAKQYALFGLSYVIVLSKDNCKWWILLPYDVHIYTLTFWKLYILMTTHFDTHFIDNSFLSFFLLFRSQWPDSLFIIGWYYSVPEQRL